MLYHFKFRSGGNFFCFILAVFQSYHISRFSQILDVLHLDIHYRICFDVNLQTFLPLSALLNLGLHVQPPLVGLCSEVVDFSDVIPDQSVVSQHFDAADAARVDTLLDN